MKWSITHPITPSLQHSTLSSFHHPNTPFRSSSPRANYRLQPLQARLQFRVLLLKPADF